MGYVRKVKAFVDGGCKGNPGPGAVGVVLFDEGGNELDRDSRAVNNTKTNQVEYEAIRFGLVVAARHTTHQVEVYSDSKIAVRQLNGGYRFHNEALLDLRVEVAQYEIPFDEVVYMKVSRDHPHIRTAHELLHERLSGKAA